MNLLQSQYTSGIKELLRGLDSDSLQALATVASKNRITATSPKEAVEVVLRYTENLAKFFSYRRITSQVLFNYLHKKKIPVRVGASKPELMETVTKEWEKSWATKQSKAVVPRKTTVSKNDVIRVQATPATWKQPAPATWKQPAPATWKQPAPTDINLSLNTTGSVNTTMNLNLTSPGVHLNLKVTHGQSGSGIRSDVFVKEFSSWFYTMLNCLQPQVAGVTGDTFSPDVFMANCSMDMYLFGPQATEKHVSGHHDCYLLLKGVCTDYKLCFVPHLDTGVQAQMSEHGLLKLLCCGSLHHGNSMVGVFEQEFGLVKCPQGKWKIIMTKINLKQAESIASLPALPKEPVFDIY